jgi:hypothetical protein
VFRGFLIKFGCKRFLKSIYLFLLESSLLSRHILENFQKNASFLENAIHLMTKQNAQEFGRRVPRLTAHGESYGFAAGGLCVRRTGHALKNMAVSAIKRSAAIKRASSV